MIKIYEKFLLNLAQKGDKNAFGKLYDIFSPKIYNFVIHRVGVKEVAEDLTMETFRRALLNLQKISAESGCFSGWLYRVASNLVVDHFRNKKYFDEDFDVSEIEFSNQIDWQTIGKEKRDAFLRSAVLSLPAEDQLIITLRFFEGVKPIKIAEILGCKVEQLYVKQFRAIDKLKKNLAVQGMVAPIFLEND